MRASSALATWGGLDFCHSANYNTLNSVFKKSSTGTGIHRLMEENREARDRPTLWWDLGRCHPISLSHLPIIS